jgi:4'-phosphopantetheinyl transferase
VTDGARVWLVPIDLPVAAAAGCREVLDAGERARAGSLEDPGDRQRFTVAHGALRILAGRELRVPPGALRWVTGPHGKPELTPPWSGLHTSLSHSGGMIAVAVSAARPVGVDIQHVVPGLDPVRLSARFFPPGEASYVAAGGDSVAADRFACLWARKEAVVKAAGSRLWANLAVPVRDRDVVAMAEPPGLHRVAGVPAPPGFRAAVALAGAAPFIVSDMSAKEPWLWDPR